MAEESKNVPNERDSSARRGTYVISAPALPTRANEVDPPNHPAAASQVFRDATNRRWRRFRALVVIAAIATLVIGFVFVRTMDSATSRGRLEEKSRFQADELARRPPRPAGRPSSFVVGESVTPGAHESRNAGSEPPLAMRLGWIEVRRQWAP